MHNTTFISDLNDRYFEGQLSEGFISKLESLPIDRPDVLAFIERTFRLMKIGGHPPTDISSLQGEIYGSLLARILPGSWEGKVPPITVSGRHKGIDEYFAATSLISGGAKRMLDIGCGFPPYTTLETAEQFPDWQIIAADPSLPVYLVYDKDGNYCTFDEQKQAVYFQPALPSIDNWNALLTDPAATKAMFSTLLEELLASGKEFSEEDFPRVSIDPVHRHSNKNLTFITGGIGEIQIDPVDVIRCFNVLFYFDDNFRKDALKWFGDQLAPGGILVTGSDWAYSTEARFNVYRKEEGQLKHLEYVFSLDNYSPLGIVTWYTNLDDDSEVAQLAEYLAVLRKDANFNKAYYDLHDKLRENLGICPRDKNGYYSDLREGISPGDIWTGAGELLTKNVESGLVDHAVDVLRKAGFNARKNEVGHVAIVSRSSGV